MLHTIIGYLREQEKDAAGADEEEEVGDLV